MYMYTNAAPLVKLCVFPRHLFSTLQSLYKDTLAQRDSLSDELNKVKRSATPRPDWERCASYIDGGSERWSAVSEGRSSDRKVDILLAQIAGVDVSEIRKDDVLQGQGTGEGIPRHLRTDGSVKHRHMNQSEANLMINGFWHHRLTTSAMGTKQTVRYLYMHSVYYCVTVTVKPLYNGRPWDRLVAVIYSEVAAL